MRENDTVEAIVPEVIGWRRAIHANPELGFAEGETAVQRTNRDLAVPSDPPLETSERSTNHGKDS